MKYDIVIIGAGPAGLTLAHTCSSLNLKILVIDKNNSIGGCHRVHRVHKYFSEHGPRIYSSAYLNFMTILKEMNVNFEDLFTPYNFQFTTIGQETIFSSLDFHEIVILFVDFAKLVADNNYGEDISVKSHLEYNNFSSQSKDIIDKICRLTDGADISRYSLNEFLQLINQQLFYQIYQPKLPNDLGLFKIWKNFLQNRNVEFLLNTEVKEIEKINNSFVINSSIQSDKVIIATPPIDFIKIFAHCNDTIKNAFGEYNELKVWANKTNYNVYVQVTFHWKNKINLEKVYGFPASDWGIAHIVLSDYMKFDESMTVISSAVTITDKKSYFINKTANESSKYEIISEVIRILRLSYLNLPDPDIVIFNPHTKYINNRWISDDTAFISSSTYKKDISFESKNIRGLYNVGTHNNKHYYRFTSFESAVTNAFALTHLLHPELKTKYVIKKVYTVREAIIFFVVLCVVILLIHFNKS
jgi:monoamine oxidase